jgi:hypothetical protein
MPIVLALVLALGEGATEPPRNEKEAYIWYLGHSGWAIQTKSHFLIFDYWERTESERALANGHIRPEEIRDQNVIVFVSHGHPDHFDPRVLEWKDEVPRITYVFGWEADEDPDLLMVRLKGNPVASVLYGSSKAESSSCEGNEALFDGELNELGVAFESVLLHDAVFVKGYGSRSQVQTQGGFLHRVPFRQQRQYFFLTGSQSGGRGTRFESCLGGDGRSRGKRRDISLSLDG